MADISVVDICNMALAKIGAEPISSLDDTNRKAARLCKALYKPILREVLESHAWSFALKRAELAQDAEGPLYGYTYGYSLPSDFLKLRRFNGIKVIDESSSKYRLEGSSLVTDEDECLIEYTGEIDDPRTFSGIFVQALSARLAAELSMPMTDSSSKLQANMQMYGNIVVMAMASDVQQEHDKDEEESRYITARDD